MNSASSPDRTMPDRKDHPLPLRERYDLGPRLHPRPLLGQNEFTPSEISPRPGKKKRDLEREDVLAVEILMQAIEIVWPIAQQ